MNKKTISLSVLLLSLPTQQVMAEEWTFGVGTGAGILEISGEAGANSQIVGPIDADASLTPSEVMDMMKSALSVAAFASKGPYTINYAYGHLELEDSVSGEFGISPAPATIDATQKATIHELNVEYRFGEPAQSNWSAIVGVQNYEQKYELKVKDGTMTTVFSGSLSDDWTDFYAGVKHSYAFSERLVWNNMVTVGGGDSDSMYGFNSTLTKVLNASWALSAVFDYVDYDYENGSRGDTDWFKYDASETSLGLGITYLF
jgi:hypothetical protein